MEAGFVMIIWSVLAGIYGIIFLSLFAATLYGGKRKKKWLKWGAGIPAGLMAVAAVLAIFSIGYAIVDSMNPNSVFKNTFGEQPSDAISDIKSDYYWFADTGSIYLRFRTSASEFHRLIPDGLTSRTMFAMQSDSPGELGFQAPSWWTYTFNQNWIYFLRDDFNRRSPGKIGFYSETEYFAYDPKEKLAYYRFLGID